MLKRKVKTVAGIMQSFTQAITDLEAVQAAMSTEVQTLEQERLALADRVAEAHKEGTKAGTLAERLRALTEV